MQGAKKLSIHRDGDFGDEARVEYLATEKPSLKTARPIEDPTNREMRMRRDLLYLWLKTEFGLTWDEISNTCKFAARSPRQIRKRSGLAAKYPPRQRVACG